MSNSNWILSSLVCVLLMGWVTDNYHKRQTISHLWERVRYQRVVSFEAGQQHEHKKVEGGGEW